MNSNLSAPGTVEGDDPFDIMPQTKPKANAAAARTTTPAAANMSPAPQALQNTVKKKETRGRKKKVIPAVGNAGTNIMAPAGRTPGPLPGTFRLNPPRPAPMHEGRNGARVSVEPDYRATQSSNATHASNNDNSIDFKREQSMQPHAQQQQQQQQQGFSAPGFGVPSLAPLAHSTPDTTAAVTNSAMTPTPMRGSSVTPSSASLLSHSTSAARVLGDRRKRYSTPLLTLQRRAMERGVSMPPPPQPTPTPNPLAARSNDTTNNIANEMNGTTLINGLAATLTTAATANKTNADHEDKHPKTTGHPARDDLPHLPFPPLKAGEPNTKLGEPADDSDNDSNIIPAHSRPRGRLPLPPPSKRRTRSRITTQNNNGSAVNQNAATTAIGTGHGVTLMNGIANHGNHDNQHGAAAAFNGALVKGLGSKMSTNEKLLRRMGKHQRRLKKHKGDIRRWRSKMGEWKARGEGFMQELRAFTE